MIDDDLDEEPSAESKPQPAQTEEAKSANPDEIALDDLEDEVMAPPRSATPPKIESTGHPETNFLALDKCLPRRKFLEVIDVLTSAPEPSNDDSDCPIPVLTYDPEWLSIARAFHPLFSTTAVQPPFPPEEEAREMVRQAREWVTEHVYGGDESQPKRIEEVQQFVMTAPGPSESDESKRGMMRKSSKKSL
jgi:lariat debranching enzyme